MLVNVINLTEPQEIIVKKIKNACETVGFFYITHHGIPQTLIDAVFTISKEFFDLRDEEKAKYLRCGYSKYQAESLDPDNQLEGDTKEGFSIKSIAPVDEDPQLNLPLALSVHSEEAVANNIQRLFFELTHLGIRLSEYFALALDLPKKIFMPYINTPQRYLRMLCYSPILSTPNKGIFAAGAHTDYGFMTILATDDQPGLQVLQEGQWHDIPPLPHGFIINVGDMMEIFSNGKFISPTHRVINTKGQKRYSMPFFYNVNETMQIQPLLTDNVSGKQYHQTTFKDYLKLKTSKTFTQGTPNQYGYF